MDNNETIQNILCEMRDEMTGCRFVRGEGIDSLHAAQAELSKFADRIEAALVAQNATTGNAVAMREDEETLEPIQDRRLVMRTIPLSEYIQKRAATEPGFCEALVNEALDEMLAGGRDAAVALLEDVAKAARKIRRPITATPRNCDVGTPTEQSDRFDDWCHAHKRGRSCRECKLNESIDFCALAWAQLPYEADAAQGGAK